MRTVQVVGGKSVEDLQNLPTDPARLAEMFLSQTVMSRLAAGLPPGRQPSPELARRLRSLRIHPPAKVARVAGLLDNAPIPPRVRAGLMRALATQPGVRAIGHDTDPLGRRGVALASDDQAVTVTGEYGAPKAEQGAYRSRVVIIFDERTGALLSQQEELTTPGGAYAEMKPGFVINYWAARSAKWTDTKPPRPNCRSANPCLRAHNETESREYGNDVLTVARALMTHYEPLKMNYETLGNRLPHLHTHLTPRFRDDRAPGRPFPLGSQVGSQPRLPEDRLATEATALRELLAARSRSAGS